MTTNWDEIYVLLKQYWGFDSFRPLQKQAVETVLASGNSLTVLPTGGGKSLCFQLPALAMEGMGVVISPLISLMKDQVDDLKEKGIEAACLNSSMSNEQVSQVLYLINQQKLKLLYLSPEKLGTDFVLRLLSGVKVSFFAIDESHCISNWGHDFRQDYRKLRLIRERFPQCGIHAFTATATKRVQDDIVEQLGFENPVINVGCVDRDNLIYRLTPRNNLIRQIRDVLEKHPGQAGIIYCLRRQETENISEKLNLLGFNSLPYHAGLDDHTRHANQDRFVREEIDIIVATVAFGMGIDRSDIRFIIHTSMPKSIENYQQETGRAGRDGLEACCYLFWGGNEYRIIASLLEGTARKEKELAQMQLFYNFCSTPACRHKYIVEYFGQDYGKASCGACDYCLGEMELLEEPVIAAQKILSCIYRALKASGCSFGADHIANILKGNSTDNIARWNHDSLSTYALMNEHTIVYIRSLIEQLVGQGVVGREPEHSTLFITEAGKQVLKGQRELILAKPISLAKRKKKSKAAAIDAFANEPDQELFELLRQKRHEIAKLKNVPPYIVFGDRTLRHIAASKPRELEALEGIFGIGQSKLEKYGQDFVEVVEEFCSR